MSFDAQLRTETFEYDNLIAGDKPPAVAEYVTLTDGEVVTRGTVLGIVTASGKALASVSTAVDGSEVPRLIAAEDASPSGADAQILAYWEGTFNKDKCDLAAGGTHTLDNITQGLRDFNIYLVNPITETPV